MFIPVSPTLSPITGLKALFSKRLIKEERIKYFSFARGSLITAIESIKSYHHLTGPLTIWLPAFICDTVVILLKGYSVNCKYYKITKDLEPDFNFLNGETFKSNDFFLLVHYFGFPIAQDKTVEFCKSKKMFLIEDCAHSIVRKFGKSKVGTRGDAGIFGLRKVLPIPNGGVLYLKQVPFAIPETLYTIPSVYRHAAKMMLQWVFQTAGRPWKITRNIIDKDEHPVLKDNFYYFDFNEPISKWAEKIISAIDVEKVIDLRRRNFQLIMDDLSKIPSIEIPHTLNLEDTETTPWIFFFYHERSEEIINKLIQKGISASYFPTLPLDVFNNYTEWSSENEMYRRSVALPVHQDISIAQIKEIIKLVKIYA